MDRTLDLPILKADARDIKAASLLPSSVYVTMAIEPPKYWWSKLLLLRSRISP